VFETVRRAHIENVQNPSRRRRLWLTSFQLPRPNKGI